MLTAQNQSQISKKNIITSERNACVISISPSILFLASLFVIVLTADSFCIDDIYWLIIPYWWTTLLFLNAILNEHISCRYKGHHAGVCATFTLIHYSLLILLMTCTIIHLHVHSAYHLITPRHSQTSTKLCNLFTLGKQGQSEVKSLLATLHRAVSWHPAGSGSSCFLYNGFCSL